MQPQINYQPQQYTSYSQPVTAQPIYSQPTYSQPYTQSPAYNQPSYQQNYAGSSLQSGYGQHAPAAAYSTTTQPYRSSSAYPQYTTPNYSQPTYSQPNYSQPNYQQPTAYNQYSQPTQSYQQPVYGPANLYSTQKGYSTANPQYSAPHYNTNNPYSTQYSLPILTPHAIKNVINMAVRYVQRELSLIYWSIVYRLFSYDHRLLLLLLLGQATHCKNSCSAVF